MYKVNRQLKFIFSYIPFDSFILHDVVTLRRKMISKSPQIRIASSLHADGTTHYYLKIKRGEKLLRDEVAINLHKDEYFFLNSLVQGPELIFKNYIFKCGEFNIEFRICDNYHDMDFGEVKLNGSVSYNYVMDFLKHSDFFVEDVTNNLEYSVSFILNKLNDSLPKS